MKLTVNQAELGEGVTDVRVTVDDGGNTVSGPSGVSHGCLAKEDLLHVDLGTTTADSGITACLAWEGSSDGLGNVFA